MGICVYCRKLKNYDILYYIVYYNIDYSVYPIFLVGIVLVSYVSYVLSDDKYMFIP